MAESDSKMQSQPEDDNAELILIDPKTDLPYDDGTPIVISGDEFRFMTKEAESRGMTFDEFFSYVIRLVLDNPSNQKDFQKADFGLGKLEG